MQELTKVIVPSGAGPAPTNSPATTTDDSNSPETSEAAQATTSAPTSTRRTTTSPTSLSTTRTTKPQTAPTSIVTLFGGGGNVFTPTTDAFTAINTLRAGGDSPQNSDNSASGLSSLGIWSLVSLGACIVFVL